MLRIKIILKPKENNSIGLFADENIPENHIVWKYEPDFDRVYHPSLLNHLHPMNDGRFILSCDDMRFIQFSQNNNILEQHDFLTPSLSIRYIEKGEELTTNLKNHE